MIIPKRDAKEYGAVHIDNYLTFTGFCKKVSSDEICKVDVYIDAKKIDTIEANQAIENIENIYDIHGHGFVFELDEKYFNKSHLLEFKATENNEELVNSGIQTIDKNHKKFNEYRLLHSLNNIDEEKIKDMYCKDAIGFLATEENLNNKDFIKYINELYIMFPSVTFKAFYFNDNQKALTKNIFINTIDRFELIIPTSLYDISSNVEIYLFNAVNRDNFKFVYINLTYLCKDILTVRFLENNNNLSINNQTQYPHPRLSAKLKSCGFRSESNNVYKVIFDEQIAKLNLNSLNEDDNYAKFDHFNKIEYALQSNDFTNNYFKANRLNREILLEDPI